jgi:hypothetical protein
MRRKVGRSRGGYPKGQVRKARSRKGMKNKKIISAMRG